MSNHFLIPVLLAGSFPLAASAAHAQEGLLLQRAYAAEVEDPRAHESLPAAAASTQAAPRELPHAGVPLSADVDRDRLYFDVDREGTVWVRGRTYKVSFSRSTATYIPFLGSQAPRNFPVGLRTESVTIGDVPLEFDGGAFAVRDGDAVEYDRGAFRERWLLTPDSVEQTFVFDELGSRGEIVVTLGVDTELVGTALVDAALDSTGSDGFLFANELGGVHYGRAFAGDAGRALQPVESRLGSGRIEIVAPRALVEDAVGPFVIDPVLSTYTVSGSSTDEFAADTAYDSTAGIWLTVLEEIYSAADHDIRIRRHVTTGVISGSDYVDFTTSDWRAPAVANNNRDDQFLVVAAVGVAPNRDIRGRTVEATASLNMSDQFDIGSDLSNRDHYAPDVGGDPAVSGFTWYCVVWEREFNAGVDYNIAAALVDTDGSQEGASFFIDGSGASIHTNPSISNSNGMGLAAERDWNVVWEDEVTPTNHNILGARVHSDGTMTASTFTVASSIFDERNPCATSIVDDAGGTRPWMVAWQIDVGADGWDVRCRTLNGTAIITTFNLSAQFPNVALDQITPSCDTAHGQFLVAWDERTSPLFFSTDIKLATLYSIGGVLGVNEGDLSVAPGIDTDLRPKVVAQRSSGSGLDDALVVFDRDDAGPQDVLATSYDIPRGGPVSAFCAGDGSGTACPCGNNGGAGRGCASSVNALGGLLTHGGEARLSADSLQLQASGLPVTATGLFFQGTGQSGAGAGSVFGDGLRCASGAVVRLATKTASSGAMFYPQGPDPDVSVKGAVPSIGALRFYQLWYRNSAPFCTASTFNLTNGLRVQWIP